MTTVRYDEGGDVHVYRGGVECCPACGDQYSWDYECSCDDDEGEQR